jgi:ATP-dependent Clp protease ATP-binding subunit ClpC
VSKKSFRVYFISHHDGRKTGVLLRTWDTFFDKPPPSAYGSSEEDVYRQLETILRELEVLGEDQLERYLWDENFHSQEVSVEVHPLTAMKKRIVIGKKRIPMRLTYIYSKLPTGAYRVMVPRFGGWYVLEDLALAPEVLRQAVSTLLLGENARWIYDFRREGDEYVNSWEPRMLLRLDPNLVAEGEDTSFPTLRQVGEELVDKAARHKLPPMLGDTDEMREHLPLVLRAPPPSILLVGGPGVGKSTWVRRLAKLLSTMRKKDTHIPRIWATSSERIIAGMVYLGMWQERCLAMVKELSFEGDYLYVDRLVSLLKPQPDGSSIGELFFPAIEAEEISLIAECSEAELERCQRRFPTLLSSFQIIRIAEAPQSLMMTLLDRYQARKEGPKIHPAGLKRLVHHLATFQPGLCFPGKGFRFLDWLGQEGSGATTRTRMLYPRDVSESYSRYSGLPVELIADDVPAGAEVHARALQQHVIGQDAACGAVARVLARFKAGLNDPDRPCGTLLFVGPTGVGKTELAKQLTRYMFGDENRMVRLDMSEYMAPGSAGRMLEVGRGVQSLAQQVRDQPLTLVLFDEIEKAAPEVFDLLLGILGEGRLTDAYGRLVDFRMALVVMTSNLGVTERAPLGFGDGQAVSFDRAVRQHFRPEFFNRIDHVVSFRNLSPADVLRVVDLELDKANRRTGLLRRNLRLRVHLEAKQLLADLGYHPTRGARPLKRVIEERVITPVAARMARDPAFRDCEIPVVVEGSEAFRHLSDAQRDSAVLLPPRAL